jgi:hypothetical protein
MHNLFISCDPQKPTERKLTERTSSTVDTHVAAEAVLKAFSASPKDLIAILYLALDRLARRRHVAGKRVKMCMTEMLLQQCPRIEEGGTGSPWTGSRSSSISMT